MNAQCNTQATVAISPSYEKAEHEMNHLLHQVATAGAILLFLLSFWSC